MKKTAFISFILFVTVTIIPVAAMGASNSPAYRSAGEAKGKSIQYIRTPEKHAGRKTVTPYGDFCSRCSKYGTGTKPVKLNEAVTAMKHYFKTKGLSVRKVKGRGRFLKAEIYKEERLVDRILFDRRTGRIRSIY